MLLTMKVLLPILTKKESRSEFLDKALKGAKETIVLAVVDSEAMAGGTGAAAGEISAENKAMEKIRQYCGQKRKACKEILEWGRTADKIKAHAVLGEVDKIVLKKQENQYYKELVKELRKDLGKEKEIEEIEAKTPEN